MSLPWLTLFGVALTALAAMTRAGMIPCTAHWQKLEAWAYGGAGRPSPVGVMVGLLLALWALEYRRLHAAPTVDGNGAGWGLVAVVPALWAVKAAGLALQTRRSRGRSGISDPRRWRQIDVARLPIAVGLAVRTGLA